MSSNNPFRSPAPRPAPVQRGPWHPLGFVQTVQGKVATLQSEVAGLLDRLKYPPYRDGVPASYVGERIFSPESASFDLDVLGRGDDAATVQPVNHVVRDAEWFTVPIEMDAPGVFMAKYLKVVFYQRWWSPDQNKAVWISIPQTKSFDNLSSSDSTRLQTIKWSILMDQTFSSLPNTNLFGMNYFWNLVDADSQRRLSNEPISNTVLLPRGYRNQMDGGLMEFDAMMLFERQGRLDFEFRLINPILQLDPSATKFPFITADTAANIDDRERGGSVRNQEVMVRVELHGTKFYNERDLLFREAVGG